MVAFNFAAVEEESWGVCNAVGTVIAFNFAVEGSWVVCKVEDVGVALVVGWWGGRIVFKCPLEGKEEIKEEDMVALVVGSWGVGKVGWVVVVFNLLVTSTCEALFDTTVLVCG